MGSFTVYSNHPFPKPSTFSPSKIEASPCDHSFAVTEEGANVMTAESSGTGVLPSFTLKTVKLW